MATNHNFKKLTIWNDGMELVKQTYLFCKNFPKSETYGLTSQIQRCAISIPSNIAEGSSKSTDNHFCQYLETALRSSYEWETQLIIAFQIGYINKEEFDNYEKKIQHLQNMIYRFKKNLKSHIS